MTGIYSQTVRFLGGQVMCKSMTTNPFDPTASQQPNSNRTRIKMKANMA